MHSEKANTLEKPFNVLLIPVGIVSWNLGSAILADWFKASIFNVSFRLLDNYAIVSTLVRHGLRCSVVH